MATEDSCCSLYPYFKVHAGQLESFKTLCQRFVEQTSQEEGCLYYGFSFDGDQVHCREGYADAAGVLAHIERVSSLLQEALAIADMTRLEVHGPKAELDKLREPLSAFEVQFFVLQYGFRR
ncbi:MAG: putative quinol monooxygenase [Planctomycetota bacterium]|jgi:quinol monooxygenase YgiN